MEMGSSAGSRLVRDAAEEKGVGGRDAAEENRAGAVIQEVYSSPAVTVRRRRVVHVVLLVVLLSRGFFFPLPPSPNHQIRN